MEWLERLDWNRLIYMVQLALLLGAYYVIQETWEAFRLDRLFRWTKFNRTVQEMRKKAKVKEEKQRALGSLNMKKYQTFRVWIAAAIALFLPSVKGILTAAFIFVLMNPNVRFRKISIYGWIKWLYERSQIQAKEFEIYLIATQLLGLVVAYQDRPVPGKHLIKQVEPVTDILSPVLNQMREEWSENKKSQAAERLYRSCPTNRGRMMVDILKELDNQNPVELAGQIRNLVEDFVMKGETHSNHKFDIESALNYISPLLSGFLVIMNVISLYFQSTVSTGRSF